MKTKTILITGATDGIGLAMAQQFHQRGDQLLLLGRQPLSNLSGDLFTSDNYIAANLLQPEAGARVIQFLNEQKIQQIDVLIHNAGTGYYGRLADQPPLSIDSILQVNLHAPIQLTHELLPFLPLNSQIVFVSSVATNLPAPDYAVYTASKAALEGFVRSFRAEQKGQRLVQLLQPGATRTGLHQKLGISPDRMDWRNFPPADQVAAKMIKAIEAKRPFAVIGASNKLIRWAGKIAPALLDRMLARQSPSDKSTKQEQPLTTAVTGAADGIGRALTLKLAAAGHNLILIDRDTSKMEALQAELQKAGRTVMAITADLGSEVGIKQAVAGLTAVPQLDFMIHNAGINAVGKFENLPIERQQAVINVNLWAPIRLTVALLQNGRSPNWVFLSSLSRFVGYPGAAAYAASKEGLANFARQLRAELGRSGQILTVYPGPTRTTHARKYSPDNSREAKRMPPEALAEQIFAAMERQQKRLIPGFGNKLFALVGTAVPALTESAMRKAILIPLEDETLA